MRVAQRDAQPGALCTGVSLSGRRAPENPAPDGPNTPGCVFLSPRLTRWWGHPHRYGCTATVPGGPLLAVAGA